VDCHEFSPVGSRVLAWEIELCGNII